MSSTNKTANYNLPQFIATDKPTWLSDVNGAMSIIDSVMKNNADTASAASVTAEAAATSADLEAVSNRVASLEAGVVDIQSDLQKIRVYDGEFLTGTMSGNATHSVTVTLPSNAQNVIAVIPFGYDPSVNWNTFIVFDQATNAGVVRFRTVGATNQYYSIRYKVFYTIA